jgi:hypothetical protein
MSRCPAHLSEIIHAADGTGVPRRPRLCHDFLVLPIDPANLLHSSVTNASMAEIKSTTSADSPPPEKEGALSSAVDVSQAATDLEKTKHAHQFGPNLPHEKLDLVNNTLCDGDEGEILEADALFNQDSPYEEVRAAVRATDSGGVANTVRAWILGMVFVTLGSGLNMFLSMRSPAINFPALVVQLLVYPIGCFWAKVVPTKVFNNQGTCGRHADVKCLHWVRLQHRCSARTPGKAILQCQSRMGFPASLHAKLPAYWHRPGWHLEEIPCLAGCDDM